ncbi:MAG: hypothetical protein O7G85_10355 [Planctomycetota bacterium]|nr:hypothetical protein [Planctomycetota bacterium]
MISLFCLALGILVTPDRLIDLGPMRMSLTSDNDSVRQIAYIEVHAFRIALILFAITLTTMALTWKRIVCSTFVKSIDAHEALTDKCHQKNSSLFNASLWIMLGSAMCGFLYIALGARFFSPAQLAMIHGEDGVLEYASVLFFLISSILAALLAVRFSGLKSRMIMHGLLAFLFFVMAGEEISWGQRIFDIETPEMMKGANVQDEINLHNMFGYFADHLFIAAIGLYGFVLPVVVHFKPTIRKLVDLMGIPVASLGLAIGFLTASSFQRWLVNRVVEFPPGFRIEELREMLISIALFLLMVESWRLSRGYRKQRAIQSDSG